MCQFPAYLDFWALYQVQSINKSISFKFYLFSFSFLCPQDLFKEVWLFVAPYALETIFFENIWSWRRILPKINHALRRWINASSVWLSHHYRVLQEWLKKNVCSFKVFECLSRQKNVYLRCLRICGTKGVSRLL